MKDISEKARLTMEERNIDLEAIRFRDQDRVRRRLFNDDDNEVEQNNITNHLSSEEEIQREREKSKERWNFDFEKGEPLTGRYEWEKVSEDGTESSIQSNNQIQNPQGENAEEAQNGTEETNEARVAN
nr:PREDICTED: cyclin-dependent kinase inhibitor 2-like isoform X3 [Linepithema humile]